VASAIESLVSMSAARKPTASKRSCLIEDPQAGGATLSTVLMVLAGSRANDPGNKVPGPPAILSLPWPYQGSQLNLEKESDDGLVIARQHFVFLRLRRPLSD
jgi:hypothetical protein